MAAQGMRSLSEHLAEGMEVRRPMWVGRVQRRDPAPGAPVLWDVFGERNRHLGAYDYLVSAAGTMSIYMVLPRFKSIHAVAACFADT